MYFTKKGTIIKKISIILQIWKIQSATILNNLGEFCNKKTLWKDRWITWKKWIWRSSGISLIKLDLLKSLLRKFNLWARLTFFLG